VPIRAAVNVTDVAETGHREAHPVIYLRCIASHHEMAGVIMKRLVRAFSVLAAGTYLVTLAVQDNRGRWNVT
jgi:hypothetical protein